MARYVKLDDLVGMLEKHTYDYCDRGWRDDYIDIDVSEFMGWVDGNAVEFVAFDDANLGHKLQCDTFFRVLPG